MTFPLSPGVKGREIIRDVTATPQIGFTGAAIVASPRGSLEPTFVTSEREFVDLFGRPTPDRTAMHTIIRFFRNGGGAVVVKRVVVDAIAAEVEVGTGFITISAANPGAWANGVQVRFIQDEDDVTLYDVQVIEGEDVVETFTVSFDENAIDGFGRSIYIEEVINNRSIYIRVDHDGLAVNPITSVPVSYTLADGADDTTPVGDTQVISGLQDFLNVEEVSVNYIMNAGWVSAGVHAAMVQVAEFRKDCVAILEMPDTKIASELVTYRKTTSNQASSFAAYYAGWVKIVDNYSGKEFFLPPSGDVAAVYSRTQQVNPWEAPAGLRRGIVNGVIDINKIWSEAERDLLYKAGINPIQAFAGQGVVVWGQKTALPFAASLDRLNVRFLFNFVRGTAVEALKPFVFQANSEFTRSSIQTLLTRFLEGVQAGDGVEDFRVVVDTTNNTAQVRSNNQLKVDIFLRPTRTAEFILVDTIAIPLQD